MRLIGLTGKRGVGKSEAAGFLEEAGFVRCHPLDGGKVACVAYFEHLGATHDEAMRMAHGDLKDTSSPYLPGQSTARFFMEHFGKFLGVTLGPEWTLGAEIEMHRKVRHGADLVVESVVYEVPIFRAAGGYLVRIVRPDTEGPAGLNTDAAVAEIIADAEIVNDGSLDDLKEKVLALI